MSKELIINAAQSEVELALIENGKLIEVHKQKTGHSYNVGDIYLANIYKLMPGLNAAFLNIGKRKDAFLHYTDLGPKLQSLLKYTEDALAEPQRANMKSVSLEGEILKHGKIQDVLSKKDMILVQVLKEPISTKGPRMSCEITLPGRYTVLTPFSNAVTISKKISNADERKRLLLLMESIKPANFGVIVRTAAEGKKVADLHEEVNFLSSKWQEITDSLKTNKEPRKILSEEDKTTSILRDFLTDDFSRIVTNDGDLYLNIKAYLNSVAPTKTNILEKYQGKTQIFEHYGINKQIKSSFGKTAVMSSGAYLVIEHTEAMHVIDVNSGPKMSKSELTNTALTVNLEAAEEIVRQLRLRDLGGLIIIDFIDMRNLDHRKMLYNRMKELMSMDRAQNTVLPLSKFGLMQITRERVRQEVKINTDELCPTCHGTGKVQPIILVDDEIERDLDYLIKNRSIQKLNLIVHPFIKSHLTKGLVSKRMKWFFKFRKWIHITQDTNLPISEYKFFDNLNDEIRFT